MEKHKPKMNGEGYDEQQIHRLVLHMVMLTKCHGWILAHDKMERNYTIEFINRLWQKGFEKGYFYRAKDGRILLTEYGEKKW